MSRAACSALSIGLAALVATKANAATPTLPKGVTLPPGFSWHQQSNVTLQKTKGLAVFSFKATTDADAGASRFLHIELFEQRGDTYFSMQAIDEKVEDCTTDFQTSFIGQTTVTDLNRNGLQELSFAMELGCHGDVSPTPLKLYVLEGNQRHTLEGSTQIELVEQGKKQRSGGTYTVVGFHNEPSLLANAKKQWAKLLRTTVNK